MTVTFSIDGIEEENGGDLPCPDCGLTLASPERGDPFCSCLGYGGPEQLPTPRFELNVSNVHAAELLESLDLACGLYQGDLEPREVLLALALRSPSCDRTRRYHVVLARIATKAEQYSRRILLR